VQKLARVKGAKKRKEKGQGKKNESGQQKKKGEKVQFLAYAHAPK